MIVAITLCPVEGGRQGESDPVGAGTAKRNIGDVEAGQSNRRATKSKRVACPDRKSIANRAIRVYKTDDIAIGAAQRWDTAKEVVAALIGGGRCDYL